MLGFHHHIRDWHHRRIARGDDSAGAPTNCISQYISQGRADCGHLVPSPCPAVGLRLALPQIIHGSISTSHRCCRVIFSWHTATQSDHNTLPFFTRNKSAPARGIWRLLPRLSTARPQTLCSPFQTSRLHPPPSSYPLGDAFLGRRWWDDPKVLLERDILLGPDHDKATEYVAQKGINSSASSARPLPKSKTSNVPLSATTPTLPPCQNLSRLAPP